jgi:hypothetical protein
MKVEVLLIGVALVCGIPSAEAQETTGPYRAGDLRDACYAFTQNIQNESANLIGAEGTCAGTISTVMRFGPVMNDKFRFCPPPEMTLTQAIPIVLKYLDDNPKALNFDLRDVANYVGRVTWPCK